MCISMDGWVNTQITCGYNAATGVVSVTQVPNTSDYKVEFVETDVYVLTY